MAGSLLTFTTLLYPTEKLFTVLNMDNLKWSIITINLGTLDYENVPFG